MTQFLSNVFNDPASPWYYVIGVLFLLLIFGALALYIIFSKKSGSSSENEEKPEIADDVNAENETGEDKQENVNTDRENTEENKDKEL